MTTRLGTSQYDILTDPFLALPVAGVVSAAPDDQMFRHLAQTYATNHLTMHRGNICEGDNFKGKMAGGGSFLPPLMTKFLKLRPRPSPQTGIRCFFDTSIRNRGFGNSFFPDPGSTPQFFEFKYFILYPLTQIIH